MPAITLPATGAHAEALALARHLQALPVLTPGTRMATGRPTPVLMRDPWRATPTSVEVSRLVIALGRQDAVECYAIKRIPAGTRASWWPTGGHGSPAGLGVSIVLERRPPGIWEAELDLQMEQLTRTTFPVLIAAAAVPSASACRSVRRAPSWIPARSASKSCERL